MKFVIVVAVWAVLLLGAITMAKFAADSKAEAHAAWVANATTIGCKRTGFMAQPGYSSLASVWTCPGGSAYLEPRQ